LPKVIFVGQLKEIFGGESLEVSGRSLSEVLNLLSSRASDLLDLDRKPSGKYVFLINGVDSLIYGDDAPLKENDVVTIVPISHGG